MKNKRSNDLKTIGDEIMRPVKRDVMKLVKKHGKVDLPKELKSFKPTIQMLLPDNTPLEGIEDLHFVRTRFVWGPNSWVDIRLMADGVEVRGNGPIVVLPIVSNDIHIKERPRG